MLCYVLSLSGSKAATSINKTTKWKIAIILKQLLFLKYIIIGIAQIKLKKINFEKVLFKNSRFGKSISTKIKYKKNKLKNIYT